MKKLILALALLLALAVGTGVANATPPNDFAVGGESTPILRILT